MPVAKDKSVSNEQTDLGRDLPSSVGNCIHLLRKRIAQLETELRALRKQALAQRQRIAQKCGHEFLALVDSDPVRAALTASPNACGFATLTLRWRYRNCEVFAIDIVQKLVVEDEEGNVIFETDGSLVGKIIEVRFNSVH